MRPEDETILSHERHLDINQWNDLDEKHRICSDYNQYADHLRRREKIAKTFIWLIKYEVFPHLSERQKQITLLYFESQLNENEIAKHLGISQPTVSQHLFGKKRNGKKIGGSIRKIHKVILKKPRFPDTSIPQPEYITAFQMLLDAKISMHDKMGVLERF